MDRAVERFAVAVIRAWVEPGGTTLKVRITTSGEPPHERRTIGVTTSIDEACSIVRGWLDGFARPEPPGGAGRDPEESLSTRGRAGVE